MAGIRRTLAVVALAGGIGAEQAAGQNALGDGTALDANQQVGSGGRNYRARTLMQDIALRNAIVTGNAASGKSFRGSVGYESAGDFRGSLGSDDIYRFQRDSYYSGLATSNLRGLSGLQYSVGQTVAGQSLDLYGSALIVRRPGSGESADSVINAPAGGYAPQYDAFERTHGALRSTADYLSSTLDAPGLLSMGRDDKGIERAQVASALSGVKWIRQDNGLLSIGDRFDPEDYKGETETDEEAGGFASPHEQLIEKLRLRADRIDIEKILPRESEEDALEVDTDDGGDEVLEERREDAMSRLLDAVRIEFELKPPTDDKGAEAEEDAPATDADVMRERTRRRMIEELTGLVLQERPVVTRLTTKTVDDLYTLHMERGQAALAEGRWFDAEERFGHALNQRVGDSMASAGRVHAQLGAGMILSGGSNLRKLFAAYPELVAVRYGDELLPGVDARPLVTAQLRDRIDRGSQVILEAGLLLAYLGYQSGDIEDIRFGLDTIDRARADGGFEPDPLVELLRAAWIPTGG